MQPGGFHDEASPSKVPWIISGLALMPLSQTLSTKYPKKSKNVIINKSSIHEKIKPWIGKPPQLHPCEFLVNVFRVFPPSMLRWKAKNTDGARWFHIAQLNRWVNLIEWISVLKGMLQMSQANWPTRPKRHAFHVDEQNKSSRANHEPTHLPVRLFFQFFEHLRLSNPLAAEHRRNIRYNRSSDSYSLTSSLPAPCSIGS